MSTSAHTQLEAIHAMLETGHRSVRLEKHTLPLWGITLGLLIAFIGRFFHGLYAQAFWLGSLAEHLTIAVILAAAFITDYRLTRRARRQRDESVSLTQKRVTQMVWLLVTLGFLLSVFSAVKFGGARHVLGLQIVLAGVVLYSIGLFAESWLRWAGFALLCLGALSVLVVSTSTDQRWLTASTFAVGFPFIQYLMPRTQTVTRRITASLLLLVAIAGGTVSASYLHYRTAIAADHLPRFALADLPASPLPGQYVVTLPAGTPVPVDLIIAGELFRARAEAKWQLELAQPVDAVLNDGRITGRYRVAGGRWFQVSEAVYVKRLFGEMKLSDQGLAVRREAILGVDPRWGGLLR